MLIYARGPLSQRGELQRDSHQHTFSEMSYGTNKMAPAASQLDNNTTVSVSERQIGQFGCWRRATDPAG